MSDAAGLELSSKLLSRIIFEWVLSLFTPSTEVGTSIVVTCGDPLLWDIYQKRLKRLFQDPDNPDARLFHGSHNGMHQSFRFDNVSGNRIVITLVGMIPNRRLS